MGGGRCKGEGRGLWEGVVGGRGGRAEGRGLWEGLGGWESL